MFGYYSKNYIDAHFYQNIDLYLKFANYYTQSEMTPILNRYEPISGMSSYFTKIAIVNNYYDKATVDNYIDAKIDASYVLDMIYNEGEHNHLVAIDSTTNTTDLDIINKQTNQKFVKFDIHGTTFYNDVRANNMIFLNGSTGNQTAMYNSTNTSFYIPINMYNSLTIYKTTAPVSASAVFGDANISFNIPLICTTNFTAPNVYNKTDIDNLLAKKQNSLSFDGTFFNNNCTKYQWYIND